MELILCSTLVGLQGFAELLDLSPVTEQRLSSPLAAPTGMCMSLPCSPPPCLASTLTVSSVPKLLPALVQGPGPNPSRAGVKCLGGAAASIPMPVPGPCHVLGPSPVPHVVWSHQPAPCAVGGFGPDLLRAVFPLCAEPGMLRQRDAAGGAEAALCILGILPLRPCRVCQKSLHISVPQFPQLFSFLGRFK